MWVRSPCSTVMALGAQDTNSGDSQSCCAVPLLHEAQKDSKQPFVTCCPPPEPWPHCSLCSINPVTGRVEEKLPNPMEGMTEEQKEHEAMKLVNMFDKLSRYWDTWCVPGVHLSQTFLWLRSQGLKGSRRGSGRGYVGNLFPQHGPMMCRGSAASPSSFGRMGRCGIPRCARAVPKHLLLASFVQVLGKDSSLCPGSAAQGEAAFWGQTGGQMAARATSHFPCWSAFSSRL